MINLFVCLKINICRVESDDEGKVQKQQGKSYFEEQEEIKKR